MGDAARSLSGMGRKVPVPESSTLGFFSQAAAATAREAYDLAVLRYREGLGNYLQVLSAEQPLLAQQSLDADLRARAVQLSIDLVRALGGGYAPAQSAPANLSMTTGDSR